MSISIGACTSNDVVLEEESIPISFKLSEMENRAIVNELNDLHKDGEAFKVWSWRTSANDLMLEVFRGERVYYKNYSWTYDDIKFWVNNNSYDFYAIYPDTITNASYNESGELTIPSLDIRQSDEYNNTKVVDLMKATESINVGMTSPEKVNLTFTHMLTNVNIDLKMHAMNEGDKMEVTYILLNGMKCVGSMTDNVWTLSEPSYFWDRLDVPQLLSSNVSPCFSNVLMLPQTIDENQVTLYVVYSYQQYGSETAMTKMLETYLPAGEWKPGEKIVYTGTLQVDNSIVFDTPQVESWGTEQVGGTIIIQ